MDLGITRGGGRVLPRGLRGLGCRGPSWLLAHPWRGILFGTGSCPGHLRCRTELKFTLCGAALVAGALLAWLVLEPSFYPDMERYGALAYQPTHLPVIATYSGGIVGLLVAGAFRLRSGT